MIVDQLEPSSRNASDKTRRQVRCVRIAPAHELLNSQLPTEFIVPPNPSF